MIYVNGIWHSVGDWAGVSLFCSVCKTYIDYEQDDEESVPLADLVAVAKAHDSDNHSDIAEATPTRVCTGGDTER